MFWRLLPHATALIAADRIVVLDVRQDRYFIVPPAITPLMTGWLFAAAPDAPPPAVSQLLQRSGVLRTGDDCVCPPAGAEIDIPITLESDRQVQNTGLFDASRIAAGILRTWLDLRLIPLRITLQRLGDARRVASIPGVDPVALARSFARVRHVIALERHCLLDSLALMRWLIARGASANLVFGISTTPFAAHCWVQTETVILNDSFDRVSRYTPIFVL